MAKKQKKKKKNTLLPIKKEKQELIVVEKEKFKLSKVYDRKVFKKTVKTISLTVVGTISIAYIMLMVLVTTSIFYVSHLQNGLIQKGVFVNGVDISGMTTEEAIVNLSNKINNSISDHIVLKYKENTYELNLKELGLQFNVENAAQEAYAIGRTKNVVKDLWDYAKVMNDTIDISSNLQYNDEFLNEYLHMVAEQLPDKVQEYTYDIQNTTLVVNKGKEGVELDIDKLKNLIISNLSERKYEEEIEIPIYQALPKDINLRTNTQ